jgi:hypothetical protein
MTFIIYIDNKKFREYHGINASKIHELGLSIVRDKPDSSILIVDKNDKQAIYFSHNITNKD